jgi:uncharacterized protein YlzI (FlbEa/FlbD family)
MLIQLTNNHGDKFYLNIELIEVIYERQGITSEIKLTNGHFVTCIESPEKVERMVSDKYADRRAI